MKLASYLLPQGSLGFPLLPGGLEERAAQLLYLVNQKGQHHEQDQHLTEMLLSQAEVVAELVSLVFQGVECLVLYFPPGAGAAHKLVDILPGDLQIRNLAEMLFFTGFAVEFPIFNKGYQFILVRLVERGAVHNTEAMSYSRVFFIFDGQLNGLTLFHGLSNMLKEKLVVTLFNPQNKIKIILLKIINMRCVGTQ